EVGDRRLAGAARPDDRGELPRLDLERDVLERPLPRGDRPCAVAVGLDRLRLEGRRPDWLLVPEVDVVELDLAPHLLLPELARAGGVDDVLRQVEVREDPLEERERGLDLDRGLEHAPDREQKAGLQRREGEDRAEREVRVAGDEEDQRRRRREEDLDEREERAPDHLLAHLEPGEAAVALAVALDRVALPVEA